MISMTIDWGRVLPVIVSIGVILLVAIVRQYSRTLASIVATMPINLPLALWVVYAGENHDASTMTEFSRALTINLVPTFFFVVVAWLGFRAGWSLIPVLVAGYAAWGIGLLAITILRTWLGV
jgi:hypothetical protein